MSLQKTGSPGALSGSKYRLGLDVCLCAYVFTHVYVCVSRGWGIMQHPKQVSSELLFSQ